jgi:hypothetical protein
VRRWVFAILSALSLLFCVTVAALWIRSYWRDDRIIEASANGSTMIDSENGRVFVWVSRYSDESKAIVVGEYPELANVEREFHFQSVPRTAPGTRVGEMFLGSAMITVSPREPASWRRYLIGSCFCCPG